MKHLLAIHSGQTGHTRALFDAACAGAADFADEVELRVRPALQAVLEDLLWADGLLIATPENFGYMSGALKDFFDRLYYPSEGRKIGMPYVLCISAGNDGSGAVNSIARIVTGCGWNRVAEPVVVKGAIEAPALEQCRELGQTIAAGLACGVF